MLLQTAARTQAFTARIIYTAPGETVQRPRASTAGIIVVSVLVVVQLLGLLYLAWYIYQVPTWTYMLDALAIAQIAKSLETSDIPSLGARSNREFQHLQCVDGTVGIVETHNDESTSYDPIAEASKTVGLGLGASGVFTRRLTSFRVKRSVAADIDLDCMCVGCQRRRRQHQAEEDAPLVSSAN